jgi:chemotaxis signal transduction protein
MTEDGRRTAAAMRETFDRGFAEAMLRERDDGHDYLVVSVAADTFALRLADITSVVVDRRIIPVPSPVAEMLGVVGVRGSIVPVYSLSGLLGFGVRDDGPRWLALAGDGSTVALAFERLHGLARTSRDDVAPVTSKQNINSYIVATVRTGDSRIGVVDVPSLVGEIGRRAQLDRPREER